MFGCPGTSQPNVLESRRDPSAPQVYVNLWPTCIALAQLRRGHGN